MDKNSADAPMDLEEVDKELLDTVKLAEFETEDAALEYLAEVSGIDPDLLKMGDVFGTITADDQNSAFPNMSDFNLQGFPEDKFQDEVHMEGFFPLDKPLPPVNSLLGQSLPMSTFSSVVSGSAIATEPAVPVESSASSPPPSLNNSPKGTLAQVPSSSGKTKPKKNKKQQKPYDKDSKDDTVAELKPKRKKGKKKKKAEGKEEEEDKEEDEVKKKRGPTPGSGGAPTLEQRMLKLEIKVQNKKKSLANEVLLVPEMILPEMPKGEQIDDPLNIKQEVIEDEGNSKQEAIGEAVNEEVTEAVESFKQEVVEGKETNKMDVEEEENIKREVVEGNESEVDGNAEMEVDPKAEKTEESEDEDDDSEDEDERKIKFESKPSTEILILCKSFKKNNLDDVENFLDLRFGIDRIGKSGMGTIFIIKSVDKELERSNIKILKKTHFMGRKILAMRYKNAGFYKVPRVTIFTDKKKK